jgi:anti-sigma B factor antagonist/stage II sporulation protein AA (anti-sigma F factor antagonist)
MQPRIIALGAGLPAGRWFDTHRHPGAQLTVAGRFSYTESTLPREARTVQLTTQKFADTIVVAPMGRIDHRSAADLEAALTPLLADAARRQGAMVLDFSSVEYISSVGLRVLMIAAKQMRTAQARLSVAALQSVVAEIFSISRFDKVLVVHATLEDALAQASDAALAAWRAAGGARPT